MPQIAAPGLTAVSDAPAAVLDVVVVGAGISGLVAAHQLHRVGLQVLVVDAAARAGGVIGSVRREGCLYESGPNSALDTTPLIGEIVHQLGLQGRLRFASAASDKRYVVRGGKLIALPMSPGAFLRTPLFSAAAKLALLAEPFKPASRPEEDESVAEFVRRRLGQEFLDYAIDPFVSGVYAGDPQQISVRAAFPKLHALEQRWGSLIRGQILGGRERRRAKETAKETAKNSARSFSFDGGMQVLTDALALAAGSLSLNTSVTALERDGQGVFTLHARQGGRAVAWRARSVVLAVAADRAATLLRPHCADAAAALDEIEYAPVASVASAYAVDDLAHPLDGFGCLLPRKEQRKVLGVLFSSSMFEGRAPAGLALLTTFIGGMRNPDLPALPEDEIAAIAHAEHGALLGTRGAPRFQVVTRWARAIPQYTLGHLNRVARAQDAERALPGLVLCASWKGGVSVGDCVRNGHGAAQLAQAGLRGAAPAVGRA